MNAAQCGTNENCQWIEEEWFDCDDFSSSSGQCSQYSEYGCYWDCSDYGWYCDCYGQQQIIDTECVGQYEIDSSYCQEVELPECSDMNEIQAVVKARYFRGSGFLYHFKTINGHEIFSLVPGKDKLSLDQVVGLRLKIEKPIVFNPSSGALN